MNNCKIDLLGPDRKTRSRLQVPSLKLDAGQWMHVAMVVANRDATLHYIKPPEPIIEEKKKYGFFGHDACGTACRSKG
jgi:hypothetical protein